MSAVVLLTCDVPIGTDGLCARQVPIRASSVEAARAHALTIGWLHDSRGDHCPGHNPARRR